MRLSQSVFTALVLVGCADVPDAVDPTQPDIEDPASTSDTEPTEPVVVDTRVGTLAFGMRFGVAADGVSFAPVTDADGTSLPSVVWFAIGNVDGDLCSITVPIDGLQLEVQEEDQPHAYAFEVPSADLAESDCTPEIVDTSWFPGGDAVSHVTEWRFEWGGPLNPDVFDWTDVEDGEEYYLGAKVAGPLMSAPEKDVMFVRAYEVDDTLTLPAGDPTPIVAADLVVEGEAVPAVYLFTVPWHVAWTWQ